MRTKRIMIMIMPALLVCVGGCKLTPRQQYASALVSVTTAKENLLQLREAKVFSDEEWEDIYPWFPASTEFLAAMEQKGTAN